MTIAVERLTRGRLVAWACTLGLVGAIGAGFAIYRQAEPNFNDSSELDLAIIEMTTMKSQPRESWRIAGSALSSYNQRVVNARLLEGVAPAGRERLSDPALRKFALSPIRDPRFLATHTWGIVIAAVVAVIAFPLIASVIWLVFALCTAWRLSEPLLRLEKVSSRHEC